MMKKIFPHLLIWKIWNSQAVSWSSSAYLLQSIQHALKIWSRFHWKSPFISPMHRSSNLPKRSRPCTSCATSSWTSAGCVQETRRRRCPSAGGGWTRPSPAWPPRGRSAPCADLASAATSLTLSRTRPPWRRRWGAAPACWTWGCSATRGWWRRWPGPALPSGGRTLAPGSGTPRKWRGTPGAPGPSPAWPWSPPQTRGAAVAARRRARWCRPPRWRRGSPRRLGWGRTGQRWQRSRRWTVGGRRWRTGRSGWRGTTSGRASGCRRRRWRQFPLHSD
mmetsp:Transcript_41851/g.72757  ORF Transcript_41851/g.72757 Transcript_41851/m.72757 type:complete len:277 (+) Transcript_41851:803-1633(+)